MRSGLTEAVNNPDDTLFFIFVMLLICQKIVDPASLNFHRPVATMCFFQVVLVAEVLVTVPLAAENVEERPKDIQAV